MELSSGVSGPLTVAEGGCRCLEAQREAEQRAERFRELCARYFHERDAAAKRVLDWFEECKVDQIRCGSSSSSSESLGEG